MKKFLILFAAVFLIACSSELSGKNTEKPTFDPFVEVKEKNILIIVGEGGPAGKMFIRASETYKSEKGGEIYNVKNGDEFVNAINDFVKNYGKIDHLEYFGHGNNVGLYVNQEVNVNGGVYVNDPDLNKDYVSASIYEVDRDVFNEYAWIQFNGCNVASGYPDEDNLAQRMANYFDVDVVAPTGPTEFSKVPYGVDPIDNSNFLSPDFNGNVYMVSTYAEGGFVVVKPQEASFLYVDIRKGQSFEEGAMGLIQKGLILEPVGDEFFPYKNITYKEAKEFCEIAFGKDANCFVKGYENEDKIRNLHVLKMLVDAYGAEMVDSNPWSDSYIKWANENNLLTKDFVNRMWYTRGEMAELTWNFIAL